MAEERDPFQPVPEGAVVAPLPRVAIQVFSETQDVAAVLEAATRDRRMAKAHVRIQAGGAAAAVEAYRHAPTPNVIVIETVSDAAALLGYLDQLAEYCDEGTRLVIIGHVNDVKLYRELLRRGVSDYQIAPITPVGVIAALSEIFATPEAGPVGRTIAFFGAKGGVGASTVAHNVAFSISRDLDIETVIADLDLPFGTAGLDFNQDPAQGVVDALADPERVDANLIDRLLAQCADKLNLLAAPATIERTYDHPADGFDAIVDVLRSGNPAVILDVPHLWTGWAKRLLVSVDEIVIVAGPDLANLRNAKNLFDHARQLRPNDKPPRLVINQVGMPKRPEIAVAEFAKAIDAVPTATIGFDAQLFGTAGNNGQMVCEVQARSAQAEAFRALARTLMGRLDTRSSKKSLLEPLIGKFMRKRA